MIFKFLPFLFLVTSGISEPPPQPQIEDFLKECAQEYEVDVEIIDNDQDIPEDKKCFHKCMAVKLGTMNDKGEVTLDEFKTKLISNNAPKDLIADVENCQVTPQEDPCDTAVALKDCFSTD